MGGFPNDILNLHIRCLVLRKQGRACKKEREKEEQVLHISKSLYKDTK
jgi:hypothetical protein